MDKAYKIMMKSLTGDFAVNGVELQYLNQRNAKYEIVRYVYMEKMKHEGAGLTNFHFTPGESFVDTPIIDIVNDLMKFNEAIKNGNYEVADFGDSNRKHNPPHSGQEKTEL